MSGNNSLRCFVFGGDFFLAEDELYSFSKQFANTFFISRMSTLIPFLIHANSFLIESNDKPYTPGDIFNG